MIVALSAICPETSVPGALRGTSSRAGLDQHAGGMRLTVRNCSSLMPT